MKPADAGLVGRGIAALCQVVLWVSTAVIFVILAINTVLRYATGASLQWATEIPELLFPWLVMSGVVLAAQASAHIATTFLVDALPAGGRRLVGTVAWLIVSALYATLAVATWRMLEIVHDERSPILQLPGSITYACVMVGMALLSLLSLQSAWSVWRVHPAPPTGPCTKEPAIPAAHW